MNYKGVEYHYAFEFKIPIENGGEDRLLNVVISNYREETQDFAGLCLENEHKVVSREPMLFAAFFDIVSQITGAIIADKKTYMDTHEGQYPAPVMRVQSPLFLEQFEKCRKSKKSLDYYERLKGYFERPETITDKVLETPETALYDCQNLSFFYNLVRVEKIPVKNIGFFRI
jgi:hypothetical protein